MTITVHNCPPHQWTSFAPTVGDYGCLQCPARVHPGDAGYAEAKAEYETRVQAMTDNAAMIERPLFLVVQDKGEPHHTIPMILTCPQCCERHIDEQAFATVAHHTHACQGCGLVWRPAKVNTHGVQFLPGYKNLTPALEQDHGR